jgi:hypothetical protein
MIDEEIRDATSDDQPSRQAEAETLIEAIPGLARIYATAWWRTAEWAVESSVRAGSRVLGAAVSGESPANLFERAGADVREYAQRLADVVDRANGGESEVSRASGGASSSTEALRERGTELLRQSADVSYEEDNHPAYARIIEDLTPDEGRILRLLAQEGPQPAVDVRSGWLPFNISSELVELGLSMIGDEAGCRHLDRVQPYLNNLNRLGLIRFSRDPVQDVLRYQVLEAQPGVTAAMRKAGRSGHTVRRSILLTPFGLDFCAVCLPVDTGEIEALGKEPAAPGVEPEKVSAAGPG